MNDVGWRVGDYLEVCTRRRDTVTLPCRHKGDTYFRYCPRVPDERFLQDRAAGERGPSMDDLHALVPLFRASLKKIRLPPPTPLPTCRGGQDSPDREAAS